MGRLAVVVVCTLVASACYSPAYDDCGITCPTGTCPSGYECMAGAVCRLPGAKGSCPAAQHDAADDTGSGSGSDDARRAVWGTATAVTTTQTGTTFSSITLRENQLEMWFVRNGDLLTTIRPTAAATFGPPGNADNITTATFTETSCDVRDSTIMYWTLQGTSDSDLYISQRNNGTGPWTTGSHVFDLDAYNVVSPSISRDSQVIVFEVPGQVTFFYQSMLFGGAWQPPTAMPGLTGDIHSPMLSTDKQTIYFHMRIGSSASGNWDLYESHFDGNQWGAAIPLTDLNTADDETDPWISMDGNDIYFIRQPTIGVGSVMHATRP